jgi:Dolichyl-phosphate-mannose-protein mannosyltransferase
MAPEPCPYNNPPQSHGDRQGVRGTTQVLPIDWHTLELQLAALLVIVASALAGLGVTRRRTSWFSARGSWRNRLAPLALRRGERFIMAGLVFTGGVFATLIGKFVFDDYPYSGDEWSYVLQAEIFSQGRLHANSPAHPRFFDVWGMVNNGKFYAWAPPGWPLLLASGILLQVPWLVNPVVGALTLLSVYCLGRLVYDTSVALLAVFFMLFSPFFLLHSASYFAHSSSLLFITLFVFFCARGIERQTDRDFLWAGLCGSMALLIRPFDQVVAFCPLGAYLLLLALRGRVAVRQLAWFAIGHGVGVILLLGYNLLQTGHPLTLGYHVGYGQSLFDPYLPGRHFIAEYLLHLLVWAFPLMPPLALLYSVWLGEAWAKSPSEQRWDALLLLVFLSNVLWYAFVPFHYWVGYGPRYYFASFFALALLGARGAMALLDRLERRWPTGEGVSLAAGALGICAALSLFWVFPVKLAEAHRFIVARQALYRMVDRTQLDNAAIFIRSVSGDFLPWNLTRNPPDFRGKVLYVHDLEGLNHLLIGQYPGRKFFLYEYDETKPPILRPLISEEAVRPDG